MTMLAATDPEFKSRFPNYYNPYDALPPRVGHILRLAEIIREVDGNHSLGAVALAEAILSHSGSRWSPKSAADEPAVLVESREPASVAKQHNAPTDENFEDLAEVMSLNLREGEASRLIRRALELWGNQQPQHGDTHD